MHLTVAGRPGYIYQNSWLLTDNRRRSHRLEAQFSHAISGTKARKTKTHFIILKRAMLAGDSLLEQRPNTKSLPNFLRPFL